MPVSSVITTHITADNGDTQTICGYNGAKFNASVKDVQQGRFYAKYCSTCFDIYWKFYHDGRDGSEKA